MFPGDGAHIVDVLYLPLVFDHSHSDRILADLWRDVTLDLEAQVFEHQVSCQGTTVTGSSTIRRVLMF